MFDQQKQAVEQAVRDAQDERTMQWNKENEERRQKATDRRAELDSKWEEQLQRNVDELQLLVNHLGPGCRLKDPSADSMGKLLKRIREASSSYQQMREEYVRNSVGAPQLSLNTAIPGSLEAAKEAIEHFCERKHRIHKVKQKLHDKGLGDCITLLEECDLLDRFLDWETVMPEELRQAHLPETYVNLLERMKSLRNV